MRTTLRFTSVVAGVALLFLWAAVILWGMDWLSMSQGVNRRIAVQARGAAPQAAAAAPPAAVSAPRASAPAPEPGAGSGPPMVPAAAVSAPRPAATRPAAPVHAIVAPASTSRAALSLSLAARVGEEADQPHGDRRAGRGHDAGDGRHSEGRGGGDRDR
jgi:hypothetical protein